jgi:hypothetical protein
MEIIISGIKRNIVILLIVSQLLLISIAFCTMLNDLSKGNFSITSYQYILVVLSIVLGVASLIVGAISGAIIGLCLGAYPKRLKGWQSVLIGGLVPFLCSLPFGLPIWATRDLLWVAFLATVCLAGGLVGWQLNNDLHRKNQLTAFQLGGIDGIVINILRSQQGWNSSRFNIDSELLEKGYDPAEIEQAWKIIADGKVWLDDNGNLRKGKRPTGRKRFPLLMGITGGNAISYFTILMFLSLFFTPFVFLPAFVITYILLVVRRQRVMKVAGIVV